MPLTKQYLTFKAECRYGVVAGRKGGALLTRGEGGRLVAVSPALEDIKLWDIRTNHVVSPRGMPRPLMNISAFISGLLCVRLQICSSVWPI